MTTFGEALETACAANGEDPGRDWRYHGDTLAAEPSIEGRPVAGLGLAGRRGIRTRPATARALWSMGEAVGEPSEGCRVTAFDDVIVASFVAGPAGVTAVARRGRGAAPGLVGLARMAGDRWLREEEVRERIDPAMGLPGLAAHLKLQEDVLAVVAGAWGVASLTTTIEDDFAGPRPWVGIGCDGEAADEGPLREALEAAAALLPMVRGWWPVEGRHPRLGSGWRRGGVRLESFAPPSPASAVLATTRTRPSPAAVARMGGRLLDVGVDESTTGRLVAAVTSDGWEGGRGV